MAAKIMHTSGKIVSNWASTYAAAPCAYYEPASVEEVQQIVRQTNADGKVLRVVGSAHSPNDCAMTDDVMVCLDRLNRVLLVDAEARLVKAQAGVKLYDLHEILDAHGLAFDNLGSISEQSIAGLISTGTHGTGLGKPTIHSCVVELQLVLASGDITTCSRHERPGACVCCWRRRYVDVGGPLVEINTCAIIRGEGVPFLWRAHEGILPATSRLPSVLWPLYECGYGPFIHQYPPLVSSFLRMCRPLLRFTVLAWQPWRHRRGCVSSRAGLRPGQRSDCGHPRRRAGRPALSRCQR